MTDYTAILDCYSLEDILDYNDITQEDCLLYLHTAGYLSLPKIQPLEFDD